MLDHGHTVVAQEVILVLKWHLMMPCRNPDIFAGVQMYAVALIIYSTQIFESQINFAAG